LLFYFNLRVVVLVVVVAIVVAVAVVLWLWLCEFESMTMCLAENFVCISKLHLVLFSYQRLNLLKLSWRRAE